MSAVRCVNPPCAETLRALEQIEALRAELADAKRAAEILGYRIEAKGQPECHHFSDDDFCYSDEISIPLVAAQRGEPTTDKRLGDGGA